ncbi:MAG: class I SAM-dependent methyltransferase [Candidatus Margulisiibacteriota bacterium]|jgi:tRNA (cmo5U34)-methyltransferase
MKVVKEHFDSEAKAWDKNVLQVIPFYKEMLDCLVSVLPFAKAAKIKVLDLGAGTGTISYLIKSRFPKAQVTCVDISPKMLEEAGKKLQGFRDVKYEVADLAGYRFSEKVDAIVTSLALHHLAPDPGKRSFYKKAFAALKPKGMLVNADIVLAGSSRIQSFYISKWQEYLKQNLSNEHIHENHKRYEREDRPNVLLQELEWLQQAGFKHVDVYWKYYNFAVYGGQK